MSSPAPRDQIVYLLTLVAVAACGFSPDVESGKLRCTDRCPGELICRAGLCCSPRDQTGACAGDGGVPADGAADGLTDAVALEDADGMGFPAAGGELTPLLTLPTGESRLLTPFESCSDRWPVEPAPATPTDRWCGYYRSTLAGFELWVVNVSEALRRPVACEGLDPACLRLGQNVWYNNTTASRFVGRYLFILSNAKAQAAPFRGTISVWRPGWAEPRLLGTDLAVCTASRLGGSVTCVGNNVGSAYDIFAGRIEPPSAGPLPKAARISISNLQLGGAGNAAMTLAGDVLAYSTVDPAGSGREVLYAANVDEAADASKHVKVAEDAARWELVDNDKKVLFVRGLDRTQKDGAGTLVLADFPSGANATAFSPGVTQAIPLRDLKGSDHGILAMLPAGLGLYSYRLYPDIGKPDLVRPIGVGAGLGISAMAGFSMVGLDPTPEGTGNLIVVNNRTGSYCNVESNRRGQVSIVPGQVFSHDDRYVVWTTSGPGGTRTAWSASSDNCDGKRRFAENPLWWGLLADRGIVYIASTDMTGADLRYLAWSTPAVYTPIHAKVTSFNLNQFENQGILYTVAGEQAIRFARLPD